MLMKKDKFNKDLSVGIRKALKITASMCKKLRESLKVDPEVMKKRVTKE